MHPTLQKIEVQDITGPDSKLEADRLPIRALVAGELLSQAAVMRLLLRTPIWVKPKGNAYLAVGNIASWVLASEYLPPNREIPVLVFGRASRWFDNTNVFERIVMPLIYATPRDELDLLFHEISELGPEQSNVIDLEQVNASVLSRLTGVGREAIARRFKKERS